MCTLKAERLFYSLAVHRLLRGRVKEYEAVSLRFLDRVNWDRWQAEEERGSSAGWRDLFCLARKSKAR